MSRCCIPLSICGPVLSCLCGCAGPTIEITRDPFARFPKTGTFGWLSEADTLPDDQRFNREEVETRIRGAIERHMSARGYQFSSEGRPTVLIAFHAAVGGGLDAASMNEDYWSWGYGPDGAWGFGPNRTVAYESGPTFERGTLIVDIVDPQTRRLLWRGSASAEIDLEATTEEKDRRVDEAVKGMLEQFP